MTDYLYMTCAQPSPIQYEEEEDWLFSVLFCTAYRNAREARRGLQRIEDQFLSVREQQGSFGTNGQEEAPQNRERELMRDRNYTQKTKEMDRLSVVNLIAIP